MTPAISATGTLRLYRLCIKSTCSPVSRLVAAGSMGCVSAPCDGDGDPVIERVMNEEELALKRSDGSSAVTDGVIIEISRLVAIDCVCPDWTANGVFA